ELRRELAALSASAPRATANVCAPDVQQFIFGVFARVGERALADYRERLGIRDAKIAAGYSRAVVGGGKKIGTIVESFAREQEWQDVTAILGVDSALAERWCEFVNLEAGVVRVAGVGERVDSAPRNPGNEFAIVTQMQFEAIGETVVPGHEVGGERAALECGRHAPGFDGAEAFDVDMRIRWRDVGGESRAELFEKIGAGVNEASRVGGADRNRAEVAALP